MNGFEDNRLHVKDNEICGGAYPNGARFEIRVITEHLFNPGFYLIDRKYGKRFQNGLYPDYVLDMIFSKDREFLENYVVVEETRGWEPMCPKYGKQWKLYIPKESQWLKRHPILRRLFQERPYVYLDDLNGDGHYKSYSEGTLKPLYQSAASC